MKNSVSELNSLLGDITDPEVIAGFSKEASQTDNSSPAQRTHSSEDFSWDDFMRHLDRPASADYKESRHICKLDKELADSIDELNINGKSRSDIINAIVRTFFDRHLDRMAKYRQENKSLFNKLKEN